MTILLVLQKLLFLNPIQSVKAFWLFRSPCCRSRKATHRWWRNRHALYVDWTGMLKIKSYLKQVSNFESCFGYQLISKNRTSLERFMCYILFCERTKVTWITFNLPQKKNSVLHISKTTFLFETLLQMRKLLSHSGAIRAGKSVSKGQTRRGAKYQERPSIPNKVRTQ